MIINRMINYKSYFFVYNLEPIPKIDRHIAERMSVKSVAYHRIKYLPTVKRIPDELWMIESPSPVEFKTDLTILCHPLCL